jgi:enoyl-CoA hydratase/carnithine racemase
VVRLDRVGDVLTVALHRPSRHNAFNREMRDGLVEALLIAQFDPALTVHLVGDGPSFCSGGDLDEFGLATDLAAAHLVRVRQSAGACVDRVRDRVTARLHGACIGAGIEIPAFAHRVEAEQSARIQLPELRMGLVPGAGGTVSLPRRIGRWRTAFLVLSGLPLDAVTARRWGLVDEIC